MLTPRDVVAKLERKWLDVLRAEVTGEALFPLQIPFGRPGTTGDFAAVRDGVQALVEGQSWRIEWQDVQTRKWGAQRWPIRLWCDSAEHAAAAIGKSQQLQSFRRALGETRQCLPKLTEWMGVRPDRVVENIEEWSQLLLVCRYFDENPRPACYPRQIPLPISTKFVETKAGIIRELLDVVLGDRVNGDSESFAERFGLRSEPPRVRFRFLDAEVQRRASWPVSDCTIPIEALEAVIGHAKRILIVENRDVFLCLPQLGDTVAVFGAGKAVALLASVQALRTADVVYWGDLDEAGYGILSNLRSFAPGAKSVFMDDAAWERWKSLAIVGRRDMAARLDRLHAAEMRAAEQVIAGPWLLEQERIPPSEIALALADALDR